LLLQNRIAILRYLFPLFNFFRPIMIKINCLPCAYRPSDPEKFGQQMLSGKAPGSGSCLDTKQEIDFHAQ